MNRTTLGSRRAHEPGAGETWLAAMFLWLCPSKRPVGVPGGEEPEATCINRPFPRGTRSLFPNPDRPCPKNLAFLLDGNCVHLRHPSCSPQRTEIFACPTNSNGSRLYADCSGNDAKFRAARLCHGRSCDRGLTFAHHDARAAAQPCTAD